MTYPVYELTLHKTYYDKGFFNLGVEVERLLPAHFLLPRDSKMGWQPSGQVFAPGV